MKYTDLVDIQAYHIFYAIVVDAPIRISRPDYSVVLCICSIGDTAYAGFLLEDDRPSAQIVMRLHSVLSNKSLLGVFEKYLFAVTESYRRENDPDYDSDVAESGDILRMTAELLFT